jgi:hypothetical protein
MILCLPILAACAAPAGPTAAPTPDPAIYNQVPETTVYEPGQCSVVLTAPAPAHTSSTLAGPPSGEVPAGTYEVGVAARYSTSLWYALNGVGPANYVNSTSVSSTVGDCATTPAP